MHIGGGFIQGFNCQAAVDEEHRVIAATTTNQSPDVDHLKPLLSALVKNCRDVPEVFTAGAGY